MGAAPLLIMLAAVGVDYGWQPDGTTSPRGDNVEYIIQIPPDQLDQIRSIGEITSAVDPAIQGRISKVVVRVGTDKLPRDAGRAATVAAASQAGGDNAQMAIPEIGDSQNAIAQSQTDRGNQPGSEALMKPDPQAGGFTLPDSLANPVRTNPSVSTDPAANRDNQWSDIGGRSTTAGAGTSASAAGTVPRGPSTDPIDPATRSTAWPATVGQPGSAGTGNASSVSNTTSNPTTVSAPTSGTRRPTDPSDPNWSGYGTTQNFGTLPPGLNSGQTNTQNSGLAGGTVANPTTGFPQTMPTAADLSRQANELQRNAANQIDSAIGASQTFARDAAGNLLDRLGRPIDSLGRLIDPESGNLVDAAGNWIDQNGRKIDRFGRPLPEVATNTMQGNSVSLQAPPLASQRSDAGFYGQTNTGFPQVGQNSLQNPAWNQSVAQNAPLQQGQGALLNQPLQNPQYANQQFANQQFANQQFANQQNGLVSNNTTDSRLWRQNDPNYVRGTSGFEEDNLRSASDSRLAMNNRTTSETRAEEMELARQAAIARQAATAPTKTRSVAAQPFFNFVLLISLVGNAYLVFETSNLRRKFRNMIANVRATKISPQPAN
ncbi:MAG TPA: hypothetical protein DDZ51_13055 [Planctomycetaceae bacterium]|nr:hypothetical protein [Planctomycetaceae bacterium]